MDKITEVIIRCDGSTTYPLDELLEFQGKLKTLSEENYVKLRNSIVTYGFSFPIFVWFDPQQNKHIIDGHARIKVLKKMRSEEGIKVPDLPVAIIEADTKEEAKEKLLLLQSQYNKITPQGWEEFTYDLPMDDFEDMLSIPIMEEKQQKEPKEKEIKQVICPNCQHRFVPN